MRYFHEVNMKVSEIISLIPKEYLEQLSLELGVNKYAKKLKAEVMFSLLLYSLLEGKRVSLRTISDTYKSLGYQVFSADSTGGTIAKSSLSDRLRTIDHKYFARVLEYLVKEYSKIINKGLEPKLAKIIKFDSTIITLSSKLLENEFTVTQGKKKQVKIGVGYSNLPEKVAIYHTRNYHNEDRSLTELIESYDVKEEDIIVFDRGLQSRQTFVKFDDHNIKFVTRLGDKAKYKVLKAHDIEAGKMVGNLRLQEDLIVQLQRFGERRVRRDFRLVIADDDKQKRYYFLSNIEGLTAEEVIKTYKQRWEIEILFKFLKQELNAKKFLSYHPKGIASCIYMIMIAAIMIITYKIQNKIRWFKYAKLEFIDQLQRILIGEIVTQCGGDPNKLVEIKGKLL